MHQQMYRMAGDDGSESFIPVPETDEDEAANDDRAGEGSQYEPSDDEEAKPDW